MATHIPSLKNRVYEFIGAQGTYGATDEEIQDNTGMHLPTELARRVELVKEGLVRDSGSTRKTARNRDAVVWIADSVPLEVRPAPWPKQRRTAKNHFQSIVERVEEIIATRHMPAVKLALIRQAIDQPELF
jgi:hypothetical protein